MNDEGRTQSPPAPGAWWRVPLQAVARHPSLWPAALAQLGRLAPRGWWKRLPPVPRPDPAWWRFRMETAYGGDGRRDPEPEDVVAFLHWCGEMRVDRRH